MVTIIFFCSRFTVYEVESLDCKAQDTSPRVNVGWLCQPEFIAGGSEPSQGSEPRRFVVSSLANGISFPAVIPEGPHPIPSRTRKLRPPGPMVLQGELCGRVGRRQELFLTARAKQLARAVSIWTVYFGTLKGSRAPREERSGPFLLRRFAALPCPSGLDWAWRRRRGGPGVGRSGRR